MIASGHDEPGTERDHMIRRYGTTFRIILALIDAASAIGVGYVALLVRFGTGSVGDDLAAAFPGDPTLAVLAYAALWPLVLWTQGLYRLRARWTIRGEIADVLRATIVFAVGVLSLLFLFKLPDVSRAFLLVVFPTLSVAAFATRVVLRGILVFLRDHGRNTRFMLIVGTTPQAQSFADLVDSHHALGLKVLGHLATGLDEETDPTRPILGSLEEIEAILHDRVVDEVAICLPFSQWSRIDDIARLCEDEGKIVRVPMYMLERTLAVGRVEEFEGIPIYSVLSGPDRAAGLAAKRLLDLVAGTAAALVASPFMLLIAVLVKRGSPGPIVFRQRRVGLHGRPFDVLKFRTMVDGAESQLDELLERNEIQGRAFKITNDPRVTPLGRWLRRTSLDELPQLWNVLRGEMSLVGPRPPLPSEVAGYDIWHRRRLSMKPGMTGLWQVRARHETDFDRWVATDLEYIDAWSFWLDLKIIAQTIPAVVGRTGR
jgi:exopolysaccharide biosynthesis polyprenyl glycosylphosphotransferase